MIHLGGFTTVSVYTFSEVVVLVSILNSVVVVGKVKVTVGRSGMTIVFVLMHCPTLRH